MRLPLAIMGLLFGLIGCHSGPLSQSRPATQPQWMRQMQNDQQQLTRELVERQQYYNHQIDTTGP